MTGSGGARRSSSTAPGRCSSATSGSGPASPTAAGGYSAQRALAAATEVVFASLPGPVEVEAVALGEQGLLSGLAAGKVYFDLSTNSPALVRRIHEVFKQKGVHMLDAPVSGGPRGAESGRLALWVGGDEDLFKRLKPVLDPIGDQAFYVRPVGAGARAHVLPNCPGHGIHTAPAEGFTLG